MAKLSLVKLDADERQELSQLVKTESRREVADSRTSAVVGGLRSAWSGVHGRGRRPSVSGDSTWRKSN